MPVARRKTRLKLVWDEVKETADPSCNIKGNVSIETGERIYHVPGQKFYAMTRIDPAYGERWFCSEADAQAAGWRMAEIETIAALFGTYILGCSEE